MKLNEKQLRKIIRESLPYRKGQPWTDPKAPVTDPVDRAEDHLDRELTDDEIEAAMGWEPADPAGDGDFWTGYGDALDGKGLPVGASPDYKAGWEDGSLDRVTEGITGHQLRRIIREMVDDTFQSHTDEPNVGELVVNINPECKHKGSEGVVLDINALPDDSGKTASYMCTNDGPEWGIGDILEKTLDQLASVEMQ